MKIDTILAFGLLLFTLGGALYGCMWQIEITIFNTVHGWKFGFFFSTIQDVPNWAARDAFYVLIFLLFVAAIIVAYKMGKHARAQEVKT